MKTARITETQEVTNVEHVSPQRVVKTTTRVAPSTEAVKVATQEYGTKVAIFRTYQSLFYILGIVEILLGFRLFLRLVGANPASGFTDFIYTLSGVFAKPFIGIVASTTSEGSVLEWSTLIAMAVYAVFVWMIIQFFQVVKPVDPGEVEQAVDNP